MIRINALVFLFIIQFLLIFLCLAVLLYLRYRKFSAKETVWRSEITRLAHEAAKNGNNEISRWKEMYGNLQANFGQIKKVNTKLKDSIAALIPEAKRSKEYERLMDEINTNNKEVDMCINTLEKENESLNEKTESFEKKIKQLSRKLDETVTKEEYSRLEAENKKLELNVNNIERELKETAKEYDSLQKNYVWLEKEYNALYKNLQDAES